MDVKQYGIAMHCVLEGNAFDPDREKVRELRMKGAESGEITKLTGILQEQVKEYCRELGLPASGSCRVSSPVPEKEMFSLLRCPQCGGRIIQPMRGRRRRFCSDGCKNDWWNQYRKTHKEKYRR